MKIILDQKLVNRCSIQDIPEVGPDLKVVSWAAASEGVRQLLLVDAHRDAPLGFGLKIGRSSKSYFAEKKLCGKTTRFVLGDAKIITLEQARELARKKIAEALEHGVSPNKRKKLIAASEITFGAAWERYVSMLNTREENKPKENTIQSIDKARRRLAQARPDWESRKVRTITGQEVVDVFNEIASKHRTTAEQVGRWASAAIRHSIRMEQHDAQTRGTPPTLTYDPFSILGKGGLGLYRSRAKLEEVYRAKGVRNPLVAKDMGKFVEACFAYRRDNAVASDFLLLALMWGARRGELSKMAWRNKLTDGEAASSSYIHLDLRYAHFHDPKNRISFDQPIAPCALEILKRRKDDCGGSKWVFPARSVKSVEGRYADPQHALQTVKALAGLDETTLRPHDLRRTAGRVAESLGFSELAIKQILGHSSSDVTARYTDPEFETRMERMERLEARILSVAPTVYNALRPLNKRALGEAPPMNISRVRQARSRKKEPAA